MARLKTVLLLGLLTGLFLWIGAAVGGQSGATIALLLAAAMNLIAWWFSDVIALRVHGATELAVQDAPGLHNLVAELAARAGIPKPRLYLVSDPAPNAFATGRNPENGALAVTSGLLSTLDEGELRGVLAHEIGHIKSRDTLITTIAATLAGAITWLAQTVFFFLPGHRDENGAGMGGLALVLVSPLVALILQLAISRGREFRADEIGARWIGGGEPLARALLKLEDAAHTVPQRGAHPAFAPLYIVSPFSEGWLFRLFSTHPSTEERVARLRRESPQRSSSEARPLRPPGPQAGRVTS